MEGRQVTLKTAVSKKARIRALVWLSSCEGKRFAPTEVWQEMWAAWEGFERRWDVVLTGAGWDDWREQARWMRRCGMVDGERVGSDV